MDRNKVYCAGVCALLLVLAGYFFAGISTNWWATEHHVHDPVPEVVVRDMIDDYEPPVPIVNLKPFVEASERASHAFEVVDEGGAPVPGATLHPGAARARYLVSDGSDALRTDERGMVELSQQRIGEAGDVLVHHPGYLPALIQVPDTARKVRVTLERGERFTAHCTDRSGAPLAGVRVQISPGWIPLGLRDRAVSPGAWRGIREAMSDANGVATVEGLGRGQHHVRLAREGYVPTNQTFLTELSIPAEDLQVEFARVFVSAIRFEGEPLLSMRQLRPVRGELSSGISVFNLQELEEPTKRRLGTRFVSLMVLDAETELDCLGAFEGPPLKTTFFVAGGRSGRDLKTLPLDRLEEPEVVLLIAEEAHAAGVMELELTGPAGDEIEGIPLQIERRGPLSERLTLIKRSGEAHELPPGDYRVSFGPDVLGMQSGFVERKVVSRGTVHVELELSVELRRCRLSASNGDAEPLERVLGRLEMDGGASRLLTGQSAYDVWLPVGARGTYRARLMGYHGSEVTFEVPNGDGVHTVTARLEPVGLVDARKEQK